jgi:hypothetical protein
MRNEGAREKLMKQVVSMTEEKVEEMVAWMRTRGVGGARHARKRRTPRQEFKGNLASMTNEDVKEMLTGTRQEHPGYLASLMRLPVLVLKAIARMLGWHQTEKQSG